MDHLEKVEKLRAKANITYEEAKAVLEEAGGDLLDAMILLEKRGKIPSPENNTSKNTEAPKEEPIIGEVTGKKSFYGHKSAAQNDGWYTFKNWVKSLFARGNRNSLQIKRRDEVLAAMPVTVFVAALFFAFWVTVPLLVIGLFCGCSYSFVGPDLERENINKAWDKASEMAEAIKKDIKREMDRDNDSNNSDTEK
ncbi:MAG: DUF4342 domain-containing protein [Clostridia bacterium]|nr:DUF4342 domain-containing protein [Clostridia bacterium]